MVAAVLGDINGNKVGIRGGSTAWGTGYNRVSCRYTTTEVLKTDKSSRRAFRFVLDANRVIGEDNKTYLQFDTICSGETYTWNGKKYYYSATPTPFNQLFRQLAGLSFLRLHISVHASN